MFCVKLLSVLIVACFYIVSEARFLHVDPQFNTELDRHVIDEDNIVFKELSGALVYAKPYDEIILYPLTPTTHDEILTMPGVCGVGCTFVQNITTGYIRWDAANVTLYSWENYTITVQPSRNNTHSGLDIVTFGTILNVTFSMIQLVFMPSDLLFSFKNDIRIVENALSPTPIAQIGCIETCTDSSITDITVTGTPELISWIKPITISMPKAHPFTFELKRVNVLDVIPPIYLREAPTVLILDDMVLQSSLEANSTTHIVCMDASVMVLTNNGTMVTHSRGHLHRHIQDIPMEMFTDPSDEHLTVTDCSFEYITTQFTKVHISTNTTIRIIDDSLSFLNTFKFFLLFIPLFICFTCCCCCWVFVYLKLKLLWEEDRMDEATYSNGSISKLDVKLVRDDNILVYNLHKND